MRIKPSIILLSMITALIAALSSYSSGTSYAELLNEENKSVNRFLVNQKVIPYVPADSVFEIGPEAPYYQLDNEGNVYMQVLSLGNSEKVVDDQIVYFRFKRWDLTYYTTSLDNIASSGNMDNMASDPASFRYQNFTLPSSALYGSGIQMPMAYLPLNSEVNLIVKSQYGMTNEISYVRPFLYRVRYYESMI